ncbi:MULTISPECIES: alkaline phosphatase [unclassified Luteococcus]|uniref:alkaline phosphatase n=1 Tax=unclassified Luteococcus TaxID=2639923 RepID=UPI00313B7E84
MNKPFRLAAAAVVVASLGASAAAGVAVADRKNEREIRNVIYLLGDGMGRTHVTAARERYYGADGKLVMETLPNVGQNRTYSIEPKSGQPGEPDFKPNYVTDSASAATAWSSGVKTYNAALGVDGKGQAKATVMELAKKAGYRTGNVSTAEITDATPAGQMSHVLMRGCQGPEYSAKSCQNTEVTGKELPTSDIRVTPVADQIARNGVADVIMGGGLSRFDAADEKALKAQGYTVLGSPASQRVATERDMDRVKVQKKKTNKVFALYNKGNLTIEKSKRENPASAEAKEPNLAEMTRKSIELLNTNKGKKKGFYLQVEGALIDKRSHANDAAQTLEETKAFDEAVRVALDFAKKDKHTMVIVTADHECAGFNIIEKGTYTNAEAATPPANVDSGNPANNSVPARAKGGKLDPKRSSGIINGAGQNDPANFGPATFRTPDDAAGVTDGSEDASLWLSYLSGNHTGADVPVYGYGPGSQKVAGSIENTDLFDIVGQALRVTK